MSLRMRLIFSYVLIIVLCLGISAASVSVVLQNYREQVTFLRFDDMTRPISNQVKTLLKGQTTLSNVWVSIQLLAKNNNTYVLMVDDKGDILRQASPLDSNQPLDVPGGLPHNIAKDTHGIFTTSTGQKYVYSAYPLAKALDTLFPRLQTLVLCQSRNDLMLVITSDLPPFIWAGMIALVVSLVLAFFLARSMYRPIQTLTKAVENIAQGHYDQAVPVTGPHEIKKLAVSFNEMADKVKESNQHLRHFVADVSHQLKSPLTSIQGFAQAIQDGTADDENTRLKAASIIESESRRMIRQVNELLELSRMQAGQVKFVKEPVDIGEILLHCQEIYALRLEEKKISLKNKIDSQIIVSGDADRLENAFSNLLDNAIKNTGAEGEIKISLHNIGNSAVVSVEDNGPGIPPEQIPHVFERFQKTSGLRNGFGLGLAIAREIILVHAGTIEVSSNPGEGARFTVILPLDRSHLKKG